MEEKMKRVAQEEEGLSQHDLSICWERICGYAIEYGEMWLVVNLRKITKESWNETVAKSACQNLEYDTEKVIVESYRERFDILYKEFYLYSLKYEEMRHLQGCEFVGSVKSVEFDKEDEIKITFSLGRALIIKSEDESPCDSHAWLEYDQRIFPLLVGKQLSHFRVDLDGSTKGVEEGDYDVVDRSNYFIQTKDGMQFPIELWHRSNGYYSGSIRIIWCDSISKKVKPKAGTEILFVVGLPGSGKSTYAQTLGEHFTVLDDDELSIDGSPYISPNFTNIITTSLEQSKSICLVSANFTLPTFFSTVYSLFNWRLQSRVRCICFENDPEQCLFNIQERDQKTHLLQNDISHMTSFYNPHDKVYRNATIKPVYSKPDYINKLML